MADSLGKPIAALPTPVAEGQPDFIEVEAFDAGEWDHQMEQDLDAGWLTMPWMTWLRSLHRS